MIGVKFHHTCKALNTLSLVSLGNPLIVFKQHELLRQKLFYKLFSLPESDSNETRGGSKEESEEREEVVLTFCAVVLNVHFPCPLDPLNLEMEEKQKRRDRNSKGENSHNTPYTSHIQWVCSVWFDSRVTWLTRCVDVSSTMQVREAMIDPCDRLRFTTLLFPHHDTNCMGTRNTFIDPQ